MRTSLLVFLGLAVLLLAACDSTTPDELDLDGPINDPTEPATFQLPLAVGNEWVLEGHRYWDTDRDDEELVYEPRPYSTTSYDTLTIVRDSVVAGETWYFLDASHEFTCCKLLGWLVNRPDGVHHIDDEGQASLLFSPATSSDAPFYTTERFTRTTGMPFVREIVGIGSVEVQPTYEAWHHISVPGADGLTAISPVAVEAHHVSAEVGFVQIDQTYVTRKQDDSGRFTPTLLHRYILFDFRPAE